MFTTTVDVLCCLNPLSQERHQNLSSNVFSCWPNLFEGESSPGVIYQPGRRSVSLTQSKQEEVDPRDVGKENGG
jgi:hypothetical protein